MADTFNVSRRAFYGLDVGQFVLENSNLSKIYLVASTFAGLSVASNFSLAGSRFRDDVLPASLFDGLVLNREASGYYINLSHCNIAVLRTDGVAGPFTGIVSALGSAGQVIDLSSNRIVSINQTAFAGVGCTNLLLNDNRISIYERRWVESIFTVTNLNTVGNPSICTVERVSDSVDDARTIKCTCAPGFLGGNDTAGYVASHLTKNLYVHV